MPCPTKAFGASLPLYDSFDFRALAQFVALFACSDEQTRVLLTLLFN